MASGSATTEAFAPSLLPLVRLLQLASPTLPIGCLQLFAGARMGRSSPATSAMPRAPHLWIGDVLECFVASPIAIPTTPPSSTELGQTLRQKGDLAEAVTTLERALDLDPEMREGYYALGMALKQQGAATRKAAPSSSSPADAHVARGQEALTRGDLEGARDELAAAVSADDTNAEAHNLLGYVLGQRRELAVAIDQLQRAIALRPEYPDAHYNLGVALWYSGRKDDAIRELRVSVQQDPSLGASCAFLGSALKDQGDLAGARRSLQHAIALLPPTPAVYVGPRHRVLARQRSRSRSRTAGSRAQHDGDGPSGAGLGRRDRRPAAAARSQPELGRRPQRARPAPRPQGGEPGRRRGAVPGSDPPPPGLRGSAQQPWPGAAAIG